MERNRIDERLKILLVSPYSEKKVGGIGTWSKSVVNSVADDNEVEVIFQNTAFWLKHNANKKQTILRRLLVGGLDTCCILLKLFYNCFVKSPHIIHYTSSASWALHKDLIATRIAKLFKIPFVIHWHFGRIPSIIRVKDKEYYLIKRVMELASKSIVIDKASYEALIKEGIKNVVYIPNAIPDNVLEASNLDNVTERDKSTILFVGQVLRGKGVYELVDSCTSIENIHSLLIAGPYSDDIHKDLMAIASKREGGNWLRFLGEISREDVFKHYRKCSVFSLPSYTEGFPYVILEAMAFGCPIVSTSVGAIPQLINPATGILVQPKDTVGLKEALQSLINDAVKAREMGKNARREVLNHYTSARVMVLYKELWLSIGK